MSHLKNLNIVCHLKKIIMALKGWDQKYFMMMMADLFP